MNETHKMPLGPGIPYAPWNEDDVTLPNGKRADPWTVVVCPVNGCGWAGTPRGYTRHFTAKEKEERQ